MAFELECVFNLRGARLTGLPTALGKFFQPELAKGACCAAALKSPEGLGPRVEVPLGLVLLGTMGTMPPNTRGFLQSIRAG